ncbi:HNH endonuclease [Vibrio phage vB_VpaM_sm033]|nr:HNH endonuclease [Vibrio phage vB_VpaM_sm033]
MGKWISLEEVQEINKAIQKHTDPEIRKKFNITKRQLDSLKSNYGLVRNWWLFFPTFPGEIWKRIRNSDTAVSNLGRFRRLRSGKIIQPWEGSKGKYLYLEITKDKELKTVLAHRMVAISFVKNPNPKTKKEVNHLDGNKRNILPENLEWCTPEENVRHAIETGLKKPNLGLSNGMSKLSLDEVIAIRSCTTSRRVKELSKTLNVNEKTALKCYYKLTYLDIDL